MSPDAKHKPAFATPSGFFQFTRMPFGLKGAPAAFQRLVDRVLHGLEEIGGAYIDDIIVFSKSWADHVRHLQAVFGQLKGGEADCKGFQVSLWSNCMRVHT